KGDFARAYFYMATRYENVIGNWENNTSNSDAVLDGTSTNVFEPWMLNMLKRWHKNDPVSAKEIRRNDLVFEFQGNRNP
ncbi:endonuclease, partial [Escherichia coli]|nr:endonuclease [Escherichia coli]